MAEPKLAVPPSAPPSMAGTGGYPAAASERLFEKGLFEVVMRDSSLGCGPERIVAGWPILRKEPSDTPPI